MIKEHFEHSGFFCRKILWASMKNDQCKSKVSKEFINKWLRLCPKIPNDNKHEVTKGKEKVKELRNKIMILNVHCLRILSIYIIFFCYKV